jgi:hypothetical protein
MADKFPSLTKLVAPNIWKRLAVIVEWHGVPRPGYIPITKAAGVLGKVDKLKFVAHQSGWNLTHFEMELARFVNLTELEFQIDKDDDDDLVPSLIRVCDLVSNRLRKLHTFKIIWREGGGGAEIDEQLVDRVMNLPPRVKYVKFLGKKYVFKEGGNKRVEIIKRF